MVFGGEILKKIVVLTILVLVIASSFLAMFPKPASGSENRRTTYATEPFNYKLLWNMEKKIGFRDPTKNYNVIVDGHGTGLAPPTVNEYYFLLTHAKYVKGVYNFRGSSHKDLSTSPYFPPIGNQGQQGSCAAWATSYYDNTFHQAKVHNWTDTSQGVTAHIMSPAWTYNKVNGGSDGGSSFIANYMVMYTIGGASLQTMPYSDKDYLSWGTERAWRNAPIGRIQDIQVTDVKNIDVIKSWIDQGSLVTFAINANAYNSAFSDGNYIISAQEYAKFVGQPNHAQTIVGYDDSVSDDGDVGAFKVVNSWGASFGDHGFYWMTYNAFKTLSYNYTFRIVGDQPNKPHLVGIWKFSNPGPRDAPISVGIGDPNNPVANRTLYLDGGDATNFPYFMAADLTDYLQNWTNGTEPFFVKIGESDTGKGSTLSGFWIEYYPNAYNPGNPYRISWPSKDAPVETPGVITNTLKLQNDLSDLTIPAGDLSVSPPNVAKGSTATITVRVINQGVNASYNVSVAFYRDRILPYYKIGSISLGNIAPGGNVSGSIQWTPKLLGNHKIIAFVDPDYQIAELNESNNIAEISVTIGQPPSAPTNVKGIRGDGYVLLSWDAPFTTTGNITGYNIYRNSQKIGSVDGNICIYNDTTVDMHMNYTYTITALNEFGESEPSDGIQIWWNAPGPVTNVTVTRGDGFVILKWLPPADDGGTHITGYNIYRDNVSVGSTDAQHLTFMDKKVDVSKPHTYYITALNTVGEGNKGATITVKWNVPGPVTNFEVIRGDGTVTVQWNAPEDNGGTHIIEYRIYRDGRFIGKVSNKTFSYQDTNVNVRTQHTYYVIAVNSVGLGAKGQELSVSWSTPSKVENITTKSTSGGVKITWNTPGDNGGSAVRYYLIYKEVNGKWTLLANVTGTSYLLKTGSSLTGEKLKLKIVPVNDVGQGEGAELNVNIPVNYLLWGVIIAVIIVVIAGIAVALRRKK